MRNLFDYACFKFYMRELTDGKGIIDEINKRGYPFKKNILFVEYNGKSAILSVFVHNKKVDIKPAMVIFGGTLTALLEKK